MRLYFKCSLDPVTSPSFVPTCLRLKLSVDSGEFRSRLDHHPDRWRNETHRDYRSPLQSGVTGAVVDRSDEVQEKPSRTNPTTVGDSESNWGDTVTCTYDVDLVLG